MSPDMILIVPHASSVIFRRDICTLPPRADLLMSISSKVATPPEVYSVDPIIPIELHSGWKNLFH